MISMHTEELAQVLTGERLGADAVFTGACTDTRKLSGGELFIALRGPRFDGHDFLAAAGGAGASAILVEKPPDAELPGVMVPDTRRAMGTLAAAWRQRFQLPVVAITGSNGKTTVKEMLRSILNGQGPVLSTAGNLNNDIGVPLTLFGLDAEHAYAVIEMGANHPGEIDYLSRLTQPDIALITQCAPAHLEGFGSVEGVARGKGEIFNGLTAAGTAVINVDDPFAEFWRGLNRDRRRVGFGISPAADVRAEALNLGSETGTRFQLVMAGGSADVTLPLLGRHNVMNALAAAAVAGILGFSPETIARGLGELQPVAGRLTLFKGQDGSVLLDDSYNANPASLNAALEVLIAQPARPWLVLGDMGELGEQAVALHATAGEQARAQGVERLYAVGELSRNAVAAFGAGGWHFDQPGALIERLKSDLSNGVAVLIKGSRAARMEQVVEALRARGDT